MPRSSAAGYFTLWLKIFIGRFKYSIRYAIKFINYGLKCCMEAKDSKITLSRRTSYPPYHPFLE
jgi:hypothetical protein